MEDLIEEFAHGLLQTKHPRAAAFFGEVQKTIDSRNYSELLQVGTTMNSLHEVSQLLQHYETENPERADQEMRMPPFPGTTHKHVISTTATLWAYDRSLVIPFLRALADLAEQRDVLFQAIRRGLPLPEPNTIQNLEVGAMAEAYWRRLLPISMATNTGLQQFLTMYLVNGEEINRMVDRQRKWLIRFPMSALLAPTLEYASDPNKLLNVTLAFLEAWVDTNFARVELGGHLAASLALTDTSQVEVKAPWQAWVLRVPQGLLDNVASIWCSDEQPLAVFDAHGQPPTLGRGETARAQQLVGMIQDLVRGVALTLNDPTHVRRREVVAKPSGSSKGSRRKQGNPDLRYAHYQISSPVKLDGARDMRGVVQEICRGGQRKLTAQFLVRGHYRNQAHGKGHKLRRRQWIEPFWKGPEDSRILLRGYTVKDGDENAE